MKKIIAALFAMLMLLACAVPALAADDSTAAAEKPYETVVAKNGRWIAERIASSGERSLSISFAGPSASVAAAGGSGKIEFSIDDKIVLRGIYLPYASKPAKAVTTSLKDDKGNIYGPFSASIIGSADSSHASYAYIPETDIILPAGTYSMSVTDPALVAASRGTPAFLIKGVLYSAYARYMETANAAEISQQAKLGDPDAAITESAAQPAKKKAAAFTLKSDSLIEEIILNTFNGGKGAAPGTVTINDAKGKKVASYQAVGGTLGKVANGVWAIMPRSVFPAGSYTITVSTPDALNYDEEGNPLFYITVSPPPETRYDFTGTYIINIDSVTKNTLAGPGFVDMSKINIKNFELTILDKSDTLECVGQYEGMPFSQVCTIAEQSYDKVVATASLSLDLTKTTFKAKVWGNGTITITKPNMGKPKVVISGTGYYQRPATKDKGADFNTYTAKASGTFKDKSLPPFVVAALGRQMGAGNIPGPDTPIQAATGLLFPPLATLLAHIIEEAMKVKQTGTSIKKYSPEWYAKNYPGKTKEQLAWIMLADAMGSTDEPDIGDKLSIGDNETAGEESYGEAEAYEEEPAYEEESQPEIMEETQENPQETAAPPEAPAEQPVPEPEQPAPGQEAPEQPPAPEEEDDGIPKFSDLPDEMTLTMDGKGHTNHYVKDLKKGVFINTETGGTLNLTHYFKDIAPYLDEDKKFIEKQRADNQKPTTIYKPETEADIKMRQAAEAQQKYKESLAKKYGTSDEKKIRDIIKENQEREAESGKAWAKAGNRYGYAETGAKVLGAVADTTIDALGEMTGPAGKGVRAGYKVLKSVSSEMADKGANIKSFMGGGHKRWRRRRFRFREKSLCKSRHKRCRRNNRRYPQPRLERRKGRLYRRHFESRARFYYRQVRRGRLRQLCENHSI